MGGGKDKHDESNKGLFSNMMHGVAGGHGYPHQGYPEQNIPITTEMAMTIANSSNSSKYLHIFYLQIIMIFKQFIYYAEEFEIVLDCFAVFAYCIYMFRFRTVLTHTLALKIVS
jgi:hypothetical protein